MVFLKTSTRANIIETLFKRQYIRKDKKRILATTTGIELIDTIQNDLLKSAELTGQWEKKLRMIEAGRHTLQRYSAAGMAPQFTYAVTRGSRTEVTFARRYQESLSTQTVLEAASLFDILADAGMLVLHSSYIVTRQEQGILFSGPSGIGKSTQAALWQRYAGAEIVNGDRALVRPDTGTVSGVFYAGTSGISRNVTASL